MKFHVNTSKGYITVDTVAEAVQADYEGHAVPNADMVVARLIDALVNIGALKAANVSEIFHYDILAED